MVNGISLGISDSNPISSAFVITVFILAGLGLKSPITGLMCASILLVSTAVGCDMQQDRSTGWRLGTNRSIQFRYQVIGVTMGSVMAVVLARLFMKAYPILAINQYAHPGHARHREVAIGDDLQVRRRARGDRAPQSEGHDRARPRHRPRASSIEALRKIIKSRARLPGLGARKSRAAIVTDLVLDCTILASPYASSFGGFVDFPVVGVVRRAAAC